MRTEDGHIIFKCLEGDPAAFGLLVDKYKGSIFALAYAKLNNFHDAEDVTQEVFIKAFRKLKSLKNRDNFLAWLYAITSNLCKDWLRSRERRLDHEIVEEKIVDRLSMESYHNNKTYESLHDALDSLSDSYRQVLVLHYLGGMDGKEIAKFLGTSQNAIMLRLSRARSQLREEMVTMMKTYETQRLPVSFTFRIVEIIKGISLHSQPSTPWISWGATITAGIIFTILSLSSTQTSFNPLKAFSELSGKIGTMDAEWSPVMQQGHKALAYAEIPVEPIIGSKGLKGNALAGSGKGDESKTEILSQTNVPVVTGNVEMQTLSGKVLRDDNPVSNAQITVYLYGKSNKYEGMTEKDGTFKIKVPKPNDKLKWDRVPIVANLPGYSFNWADVSKDETSNIIMKLPKPATISGIVSDKSDKPILGAEVAINFCSFDSAFDLSRSFLQGDLAPNSRIRTDSDGKFAFRNLPDGVKVRIEVTGQGYAREMKNNISAGTEGIVIKLKPEARIEGKVTFGDTGKPAKGIAIHIQGIHPTQDYGDAITDENGYYKIINLSTGQFVVMMAPGNEEWTAIAREYVKVAEGETIRDVNLKLTKGVMITGKVMEKDTNKPISDVWVGMYDSAHPQSQDSNQSCNTDKDGNFSLRAAPGKAKFYLSPPQGYEPVSQVQKTIDVTEGHALDVYFYLSPKIETLSIKGSVFSPDGDPVASAIIVNAWEWYKQIAVSDKDGKFTISGLRQGQKITVKADQKELHLRGTTEIQVSSDEDIEIIMQKYEITSVTGRVVNRKGEPIASADMIIMRHEGEITSGTSTGIADGSGKYKIDNLIVGDEYYVNAKADGYREANTEMFTATKDMKPLPDIVLETPGKYFLEGTIKDTSGKPIVGATVLARRSPAASESRTDENGYYKLENLVNMVELEIAIDHPDYGYNWFWYIPTNEKRDFVLKKADRYLSGKVVDTDGNPVSGAEVYIESDFPADWGQTGHRNLGKSTDAYGNFSLDHQLVNKKADISVNKEGYYKIFKDTEMDRDNVVLTYTKEGYAGPPQNPSPEEIEKDNQQKQYYENVEKQAKEIIDKPVPELDVEQWIAEKPLDLSKLKGKVIVLHFWSYFGQNSVDKASLETIRFLNAIQKAYSDKGVVFVSIHANTQKIDELKKLVKEWNPAYNIGIDKKSPIKWAKGVTFDRFGVSWGQRFLLIDKVGTVKYQTWNYDLEKKIQELISD
jgi:RNA polymerase sigma factor (sigma-70 family)